jgi:hypothetical protein
VFTCTGVTLGEITSVFSICSSSDSVSISELLTILRFVN